MPGIVPERDIPEGVPLPPRYATAPADNTISAIMENVRQAGLAVASGASTLAAKRRAVADTTELAKRKMMIETDLDDLQTDIRGDRDLHKDATGYYDQAVNNFEAKWLKDLRPDLQAIVKEYAARRATAGRRRCR